MGSTRHLFERELDRLKRNGRRASDVDLDADDLAELVRRFEAVYREGSGRTSRRSPRPADQSAASRLRLLEHAAGPGLPARQRDPRRSRHGRERRSDGLRKQRDTSATGVAFTRNPSTGEPGVWASSSSTRQGEDVVAGIRTPEPIERWRAALPDAHATARRDDAAARDALPRDAGHRVHGRGGLASTSSRRAPASAPLPRPCGSPSTWRRTGSSRGTRRSRRIDPASSTSSSIR